MREVRGVCSFAFLNTELAATFGAMSLRIRGAMRSPSSKRVPNRSLKASKMLLSRSSFGAPMHATGALNLIRHELWLARYLMCEKTSLEMRNLRHTRRLH